MSNNTNHRIVEEIVASIDIPESAYEKAIARYKDLGEWFGRPEAKCAMYAPHIFPQGSFRLGTVVRGEEYDLDFGCRLRKGVSKSTHTQKQLKTLVGKDMEDYRLARRIESALKEKPRCWRLQYADELNFHMDGVPSIPTDGLLRQPIIEAMMRSGTAEALAREVAEYAGSITDNRQDNYEIISPDWRISNSEGYALWFESRMRMAVSLQKRLALQETSADVEELPTRRWKSPLQQCVQILKRHRDVMFLDDPDGKPISVIITTLAAEAYQGEEDVGSALEGILANMGRYVRKAKPRVPNPVNPVEDFADKWYDPKHQHLNLEGKFNQWLMQVQTDFDIISQSRDPGFIAEQVHDKFASTLDERSLREKMGLGAASTITSPKRHTVTENPAKPWMR